MSASERVVLVGWGAINRRVAALLAARGSAGCLVGVAVRDPRQDRPDLPEAVRLIAAPGDLAALAPTLVVEAAGRAAVQPWGLAALACGAEFAVSSTSAFVDPDLLDRLTGTEGGRVIVPAGALGGLDALSAAARLGIDRVTHRIVKPALAWTGTAAEGLCDLAGLTGPVTFFEASAREAADTFPQNANATIITALAGIGPDRTRVALVADPAARLNSHEIEAEGDFGELTLRIGNRPLATNPKSSEMTALNLVRLIENRSARLVL